MYITIVPNKNISGADTSQIYIIWSSLAFLTLPLNHVCVYQKARIGGYPTLEKHLIYHVDKFGLNICISVARQRIVLLLEGGVLDDISHFKPLLVAI